MAVIRTVILVCYMVTNVAIVANAVRHWNDVPERRDGRVVYGTGLENQRG